MMTKVATLMFGFQLKTKLKKLYFKKELWIQNGIRHSNSTYDEEQKILRFLFLIETYMQQMIFLEELWFHLIH